MIAEPASDTEVLVDIGADKVSIAVHTLGRPRFVRVIPGIGGDSLTRALDESEDFGPGHAEGLKLVASVATAQGRPAVFSLTDAALQPSPAAQARLQAAAQHIVDEVSDTLTFYASSDPDHVPTQVRLTGQGSEIAGFDVLCARTLELPVGHLLGTSSHRNPRTSLPDPDLAVSIGLCLGVPA